MEKLVLVYNKGDGCTYGYVEHKPVEFESAEALYVLLEEAILKFLNGVEWLSPITNLENDFYYVVGNHLIATYKEMNFTFIKKGDVYLSYEMPEILTLGEWFEKYKVAAND